jgi:hypothetical protein
VPLPLRAFEATVMVGTGEMFVVVPPETRVVVVKL